MESFKSHILVIDDDEGIRSLLKQFLNENGYLVNTASNALEAKEKISIIKFDLLVLDIMMPGKSGLEFISENKNNLNVPIILLTAKGEASERVEGLETGADDYLPKPFEPKELLLRINNILKKTKKVNLKHVLEFGSIKIDLNKLMITNQNSNFKINNTEKTILEKINSYNQKRPRKLLLNKIELKKQYKKLSEKLGYALFDENYLILNANP